MLKGSVGQIVRSRRLGGTNPKRDKDCPLPFHRLFPGIREIQEIKALFGERTNEVIHDLKVEFDSARFGYMSVSEDDGHLLVSSYHLKTADLVVLYLDVFRELHHVKQFMDGKSSSCPM